MPELIDCEICIAMNQDGEWIVLPADGDNPVDELVNNYGAVLARVVRVTVRMTAPVEQTVGVTVPETAGETTEVSVAEGASQ